MADFYSLSFFRCEQGVGAWSVELSIYGDRKYFYDHTGRKNIREFGKYFSKPDYSGGGIGVIFAVTFNVPCVAAVAATYQETHSMKWTLRIAGYYILMAFILAFLAYRIGLLIF